jgi:hypothetical protein
MRRLILLTSLLAGLALVAGCAVNSGAGKRSLYVDSHPELDVVYAEAILNGQIMVGMSQEMVEASWGKPSRVENVQSTTAEDPTAHWVYGNVFVSGTITDLFFNQDGQLLRYEVNSHEGAAGGGRIMTAEQAPKSTLSGNDVLSKGGGGGHP